MAEVNHKRIVLKFGTGILTRPDGDELDLNQFERLSGEVASVHHSGCEVVLVSSGAVGAGLMALGLTEEPRDLPNIQACAAIGQTRLMELYHGFFARDNLLVAQLLLTPADLDSRRRYMNARNTLNHLLSSRRAIPIINENDSVATEAIRVTDNDLIAAEVAILIQADLLVILSGVEGLTQNTDGTGEPFRVVEDISTVEHVVGDNKGRMSRGGMRSKLDAIKIAVNHGIQTVIANGRQPGNITAAVNGERVGTTFLPQPRADLQFAPLH